MWKIEGEEVRLLLDPADHHKRFAKVRLGMTGRMAEWREHLLVGPLPEPDVILDDGVAAIKPSFIAQPLEDAPGGVTLLARTGSNRATPDHLQENEKLLDGDAFVVHHISWVEYQ